jgi:membrane associated rhomboid family serine protease
MAIERKQTGLDFLIGLLLADWLNGHGMVWLLHNDYQVGHWAHLGGFFASLFVFFFLRPDAFHRYRNELPL